MKPWALYRTHLCMMKPWKPPTLCQWVLSQTDPRSQSVSLTAKGDRNPKFPKFPRMSLRQPVPKAQVRQRLTMPRKCFSLSTRSTRRSFNSSPGWSGHVRPSMEPTVTRRPLSDVKCRKVPSGYLFVFRRAIHHTSSVHIYPNKQTLIMRVYLGVFQMRFLLNL